MGDASWESKLLDSIETHAGEVPDLAAEVARTAGKDEAEVARFAARYLERCGLFPFVHDAGGGRLNVLARYGGHVGSFDRHLVLCGYSHLGASADAGRLASALWATGLVARLGVPLAGPLTMLVVGDEREGRRGVPWVLDRDLIERPSAALIAGPSDRVHPGIGQLGRCQFEVHLAERGDWASDARGAWVGGCAGEDPLSGRAAGSPAQDPPEPGSQADVAAGLSVGSRCEQDESVIVRAATAVLALRQVAGLRAEVPRDVADVVDRSRRIVAASDGEDPTPGALFDHVNINIGTIHGGSAIDAAPRRCVIGVDCALPFGVDQARVLGEANRLLVESDVRAEIVERGSAALASVTATAEPLVRSLLGAVRDVVDARAQGILHLSAGDARWFRGRGVPAAQYGPGDGRAAPEAVRSDAATVYVLSMLRYLRISG